MSLFGKIGHAIGHGIKQIGGLAEKAAPFVGMIPGVGTLAGGAIGGLGALAHGDGLSGALRYGAEGAAGGLAHGLVDKIPGGEGFLGKVGSVLKTGGGKLGQAVEDTFIPGGKLDLGKLASVAGAGASMIGQAKQRKSATRYNNAMIDQRNQLMNKILAPQNYNLPPITPNLNEQASTSSGY